ncbi:MULTISPECIES: phenazine biosynthesis FMN-dependent oxidase PhzG [Streptomyces]|uniref:Pyridoxamine 5'-phosphate oxidase n=1 Tax=Streptomyces spororaveus TaxID=284039 RepID=A0ABQ3TF35_9ACTN|nr:MULTISPECIES: phenazine biosynthesis FMN-dependent oxidase PhzG [Streptomyces]MCM9080627.1 phenazine biosynthesis FMN-dependent oxidase PhzG [Streptomyces spororaveus]MCX5304944.1 phenazine biosynthesis FMN-dependent oxidase PhzG [Streptomyces sp. NBC_00160]GHI79025.1 pyridoxamine 5'-phosphate oxidase [Streptomyces spororaveus]
MSTITSTSTPGNSSKFESLSGETDLDFPEYDNPAADPVELLRTWLTQAGDRGVREPRALALATADARGRASTRIIAITAVTDRGLVFMSHTSSQKGREIAETGWASGLLYWRETAQQISISGEVEQLGDAESDALWYGRPVPMHAMSTAAHQSEPLDDVAALREAATRLEAAGTPLPRPERFVGYLLVPSAIEFWAASSDRLHRRLRYDRLADRSWSPSRLQP